MSAILSSALDIRKQGVGTPEYTLLQDLYLSNDGKMFFPFCTVIINNLICSLSQWGRRLIVLKAPSLASSFFAVNRLFVDFHKIEKF